MSKEIEEIILEELKEIKQKLNNISEKTTVVYKDMYGNGKPGVVNRVFSLEKKLWWFSGAGTTIGVLINILIKL